jgi:hypothetical protein
MEGTGHSRPFLGISVVIILALAVGWFVGALGLALAFTTGAALTMAVVLRSSAARPTTLLTAATSEPPEGWSEFHRELARARRFDRPFGIVRYVGVGQGVMTDRHLRDKVAALGRRIDRVWLDGGDLFVLMPESDAGAVETAVARARYRVGEALERSISATFPANGITSGSLIACLYQGDASPVAIGALGPVASALSTVSSTDGGELAESAT